MRLVRTGSIISMEYCGRPFAAATYINVFGGDWVENEGPDNFGAPSYAKTPLGQISEYSDLDGEPNKVMEVDITDFVNNWEEVDEIIFLIQGDVEWSSEVNGNDKYYSTHEVDSIWAELDY